MNNTAQSVVSAAMALITPNQMYTPLRRGGGWSNGFK
jgi:hypothetical protein